MGRWRSTLAWVAAIAAVIVPAAWIGNLVTTFLFAFSGGQYRMVAVVNAGTLLVLGAGVLVAAVSWRVRSPAGSIVPTAVATGVSWVIALVAEWLISFRLGA